MGGAFPFPGCLHDLTRLRRIRDRIDRAMALPWCGGRRVGPAFVRGPAGDATGQASRGAGGRARSSMTAPSTAEANAMEIAVHACFLPHTGPDAALAFYRDTPGFGGRSAVGWQGLRWITVGPPGQPETSLVLAPPSAGPGVTADEKRTMAEMMTQGTCAMLLATPNLDNALERIQASGAEIMEEATMQPYGGIARCAIPPST